MDENVQIQSSSCSLVHTSLLCLWILFAGHQSQSLYQGSSGLQSYQCKITFIYLSVLYPVKWQLKCNLYFRMVFFLCCQHLACSVCHQQEKYLTVPGTNNTNKHHKYSYLKINKKYVQFYYSRSRNITSVTKLRKIFNSIGFFVPASTFLLVQFLPCHMKV